jgi:hypothetical protein
MSSFFQNVFLGSRADERQFENRIILAHARAQLSISLTPAASPCASRPVME